MNRIVVLCIHNCSTANNAKDFLFGHVQWFEYPFRVTFAFTTLWYFTFQNQPLWPNYRGHFSLFIEHLVPNRWKVADKSKSLIGWSVCVTVASCVEGSDDYLNDSSNTSSVSIWAIFLAIIVMNSVKSILPFPKPVWYQFIWNSAATQKYLISWRIMRLLSRINTVQYRTLTNIEIPPTEHFFRV